MPSSETHHSPLLPLFEAAGCPFLPYGPADAPVPIPAAVSYVEAEYAALRKSAAILDQPHRGTLRITGADRHEFLGRMLTQVMRDFAPFTFRRAFWLNRKGRIDADLRLVELGDLMLVDLDVFSAPHAVKTLTDFLFAEDVQIEDGSGRRHRLALHGPLAPAVLAGPAQAKAGPAIAALSDGQACRAEIDGAELLIERQDSLAVPGFELTMDRADVERIWHVLAAPLSRDDGDPTPESSAARPIGWHAYNLARIEAGWPLFNIDFGPTNLPHETGPGPGGVLRDRVSFTKGCYLGQEIVARMESLGKPKQVLAGLRLDAGPSAAELPQPATGSRILREPREDADLIGAVTSSAVSPMLGGTPICFAMVKQASSAPGTQLFVEAEGAIVPATVQPGLRFWPQT